MEESDFENLRFFNKEEVEVFLETILSVTNMLTRVESSLNILEDSKHLKDAIGLMMLNKKVWDHMFMPMRNQKKRNHLCLA